MATVDDIITTWEEGRESGNVATPEELCQDFPELLEEVRWQIQALMFVESHFGHGEHAEIDAGQTRGPARRNMQGPLIVSSEYRIEHLHASGGLGDVFVASDSILKRRVALKFPRADRLLPDQLIRFEREARITAKLDHPGIVPVHAMKTGFDGEPCYVMRFVEGLTFQERIRLFHEEAAKSRRSVDFDSAEWRTLLQHFVALCNIVAFAHDQGVVHRDIKPGNVVLGPFGETLLLDWGLARIANESDSNFASLGHSKAKNVEPGMTREGQVLGTPAFASPEQLVGDSTQVDHRTDIYSLGATLFYLLTGTYVCQHDRFGEWLERLRSGDPSSARARPAGVPIKLDAICRRAMAKSLDDRYQSAIELRKDLESYLAGGPVSVVPESIVSRLIRTSRKYPGWFSAVAVGMILTAIGSGIGAGLLGRKNQQLSRANQRLEAAISDSLLANQQTLEALRSMVDDVVIRDLSGHEYPDQAEQDYLGNVLRQYAALAELQGDNVERRAIRAEGALQIGRIQLRLSDESAALEKLRAAVAQFEKLAAETNDPRHLQQLAQSKGELCVALMRLGKLDEACTVAEQAIHLAEQGQVEAGTSRESLSVAGNLYRIGGTVRMAQRDWPGARRFLEQAQGCFLQSLEIEKVDANIEPALGAVYRLLGDVARQQGDFENQSWYMEQSLETQRMLVRDFPDRPRHELGLVLALNSISGHREFTGQISAALTELDEAVAVVTRLVERFPTVEQYQESLAGIHYRRGLLFRTQNEPLSADRELAAAVKLFSALRLGSPDLADYELAWQEAMLDWGRLKIDTARFDEGAQILTRLIASRESFVKRFSELAKSNLTLTIAESERTRLHRRMGLVAETEKVLRSAILRFDELAQVDRGGQPEYWSAKSRVYLSRTLRALKQPGKARSEMDLAVETVLDLTKRHSEHLEFLGTLALLHRDLAIEFGNLQQSEQQKRHQQFELDLRKQIVQGMPENPYYRVQLAQAYIAQADAARVSGQEQLAWDGYTAAKSVVTESLEKYPTDVLVQKTTGDLCTRRGRLLFALREFEKAELEFAEAVRLNPSIENRASRANNLAWIKPERVLIEVDNILAERIPDKVPLKSLLQACSTAARSLDDAQLKFELENRVVRMLQHMLDEKYSPNPTTLKELREHSLYAEMRLRPDYLSVLDKLEQQEQDLKGPAFIRQLPEWFKPSARWLVKQRWDRVLRGEFR